MLLIDRVIKNTYAARKHNRTHKAAIEILNRPIYMQQRKVIEKIKSIILLIIRFIFQPPFLLFAEI